MPDIIIMYPAMVCYRGETDALPIPVLAKPGLCSDWQAVIEVCILRCPGRFPGFSFIQKVPYYLVSFMLLAKYLRGVI
jgi:hypothetical protein